MNIKPYISIDTTRLQPVLAKDCKINDAYFTSIFNIRIEVGPSTPIRHYTTNIKPGWSWLGMLGYGDFINFVGVAILAGVTIICYLAIIPIFLKTNDKVYAFLALLEVVILCLAASSILAVGH